MTDRVRQLQGVWFPTHQTVEGRLTQTHAPAFPAPRDVALMSVVGDTFHVSVNAEYYWTGGRFSVLDARTIWFSYPGVPDEYNIAAHYDLVGDELRVCSRPADRSWPSYVEYATRYVRVAPEPTPEMRSLFELIMRGWTWAQWDWDRKCYRSG
jgi:hypothetical protein